MERENHFLQNASAVCTIITAISAGISKFNEKLFLSKIFLAMCVISFSISLFFVVCSYLKRTHSYLYRRLKYACISKGSYILKSREIVYEFIDREHIKHSKKFVVIPRTTGFDTFTDRYVYSGDHECVVRSVFPRQRIVDTYKDHGWNFYSIKLSEPAPKGMEKEFGMKMDTIKDLEHKSKPFLSTGIYEPTENLVMDVYFRNGLVPHGAKIKIFDDYVDRTPIFEQELAYDSENHRLRYEVAYPIYHYKYLIVWNFEDP